MIVPASFKYMDRPRERSQRRSAPPRSAPTPNVSNVAARTPTVTLPHRSTVPVQIPSSKSTNARVSELGNSEPQTPNMRSKSASLPTAIGRRKHAPSTAHDPNALPPAIAALLAVTAIPPRRPNRYRSKRGADRRISIEELVSEWKSDESLKHNYGSSAALSVLLEDAEYMLSKGCTGEMNYLTARSASAESMPSLTSDDHSVLSDSESTPGSLRSRRSFSNLKKEKSRSLPAVENCALDHPLAFQPEAEEDGLLLPIQKKAPGTPKSSSFKSNLTLSLQSIKNAAVSSISSLARSSSPSALGDSATPHIDHMLWSHPFLFPRYSSEIRPAVDSTGSETQRRYLNPAPLTFEEWEAPFQQALHAPYLAEAVENAPTIQMQTYNRGRRRGGSKRGSPSPSSEAGRALLGPENARRREVRENSDFLRVVVLEMNMRRKGKLETGRAKICLPPRDESLITKSSGRIPRRWVGISAY